MCGSFQQTLVGEERVTNPTGKESAREASFRHIAVYTRELITLMFDCSCFIFSTGAQFLP